MLDMSGKYLGFALAMWHGSCPNSSPTRFKNVLSSWLTFITCKKTFLGWNGAMVLHGINNHIYSLYHSRFKRFRRDIIFDLKQGLLCQKSNGRWIQSRFKSHWLNCTVINENSNAMHLAQSRYCDSVLQG